jgi:Helicase subunit of the DNA excision repair complex
MCWSGLTFARGPRHAEVSLVAIMDADKEGFLRSDRSLIQTIGRAARNVNGHAILYADKITDSMQRAIDETERRRTKQLEFNAEHGITPQTIIKRIDDVMEGAHRETPGSRGRKAKESSKQDANLSLLPENPQAMTPVQLAKEITRLEDEMFKAAKSLEFEKAAAIRDALSDLQAIAFK